MFVQSRGKQTALMLLGAVILAGMIACKHTPAPAPTPPAPQAAVVTPTPAATPATAAKGKKGKTASKGGPRFGNVMPGPKADAKLDYTPGVPPKFWSIATAETIMARYPDYRAAYHGAWTYVHGYTFYAFEMISKYSGDKKFIDYEKKYLDNFIDAQGQFSNASLNSLDNLMTGNSIIAMYELTGDERYKKAAGQFRHRLDNFPQSKDGQFYHGSNNTNTGTPNMWIDGIFMGQMMLTRYGKSIGDSQFCFDTAARQFTVFAKHCLKGDSGLYLHAWTEANPLPVWADPETHNSPEVWSEGLGWYALVVVETLGMMPKDHPQYGAVLDIYKRMMAGLKKTQDEKTGGWWMIVDKGTTPGNWIDPSGTGMFTYAIQRGIELGLLDKAEYGDCPKRGWECLKRDFARINDQGLVDIVGGGDGITIKKDFNTYVSVRRMVNAKETVGAFLWASAIMEKPELEKLKK